MITKECLIAPLAVLGFTFSSEIAQAAENNDAGFLVTAWPLIVLSIVLVVFRKQLIIQATPEKPDSEHHEAPKKAAAQTPKQKSAATKKQPAAAKAKAPKKSSRIDIKNDSGQCQAATAKGTRCKRTSSLENATASINGKTYELTACKQHNNDALEIFSEFIK